MKRNRTSTGQRRAGRTHQPEKLAGAPGYILPVGCCIAVSGNSLRALNVMNWLCAAGVAEQQHQRLCSRPFYLRYVMWWAVLPGMILPDRYGRIPIMKNWYHRLNCRPVDRAHTVLRYTQ
ncbi:hypothetical protein KCP71_03320 [Salmonella enterica subsp. enterica]|nr:hypothetical protein KCP71_03320 [Salmonella enterica subsp. enterica]